MINFGKRTIFILLTAFMCVFIIFDHNRMYFKPKPQKFMHVKGIAMCKKDLKSHDSVVAEYFEKRQGWYTSNLGAILFQNISPKEFTRKKKKTFLVLVWKYWNWLKKRHVYSFRSSEKTQSPIILKGCSVKNCKFSGNDTDIDKADAVIVHMMKGRYPIVEKRNPKQRWILLSDESPMNTFSFARKSAPKMNNLDGIFNWTMTYRSDSDVPVPYGRTVSLAKPAFPETCSGDMEAALRQMVPYWDDKQFAVLAMILMSNCHRNRLNFINALRHRIAVDIHGKCSDSDKKTCPGHFRKDCIHTRRYLFYLVLENSSCRQYLTEKIFYHAYSKGAIPVISGPPLEDCQKLLPPNSFLHVANFKSIWELAVHMEYISSSLEAILSYHAWRRHFAVENEHGYFGSRSVHLCRVCQALNYNDEEESVYDKDELKLFLDKDISCDKYYGNRRW